MRIVLISLAALALAGCGGGESDSDTHVVAAFYPLAFAVERIAGEDAEVTNLTPPGVEPHDVELSAHDARRIFDADLVVYLGAGFQPALERAVDSTDGKAVDVLEGLSLRPGDTEDGLDPHVWLDPVTFQGVVARIALALDVDPERARPLLRELERLDAEYREGLRDCERHELVTSHAAFGYLARYGLEQIAITGLSPEAEPTPGELSDVVAEVREHGATTVFFETLVSPRLAQTVAREVGAETAVLNPLEGLTQTELDRGEDYFSIMRDNLAALQQALGCR